MSWRLDTRIWPAVGSSRQHEQSCSGHNSRVDNVMLTSPNVGHHLNTRNMEWGVWRSYKATNMFSNNNIPLCWQVLFWHWQTHCVSSPALDASCSHNKRPNGRADGSTDPDLTPVLPPRRAPGRDQRSESQVLMMRCIDNSIYGARQKRGHAQLKMLHCWHA